ncbi:MAG: cell division protein FtsZ [Candidatus Nealsonbacteria bacterium]
MPKKKTKPAQKKKPKQKAKDPKRKVNKLKRIKKVKKSPRKRMVKKTVRRLARKRTTKKPARKPVRKKPKNLAPGDLVHRTRIRVIGLGGGGGSIVSEIAPQLKRVDFVVANTDSQALKETPRSVRKFAFGQKMTGGLGTGMDVRVGQKAAQEEKEKIEKLFQGVDLCILVCSLGGGTGSGAAPEFARMAKESGIMVFGIFTLPFKFEGNKRLSLAKNSLSKITPYLNAVSIIPNENIFKIIDKKTPLKQAFSTINKRLAQNLKGLIEMIYLPGTINIDFADLKTILDGQGKLAYLNSSQAQGSNRVEDALKEVLHSPLNEYGIRGSEKMIFNITASEEVGMREIEEISQTISDFNRRAKIIFGISQDNNYKDRIRISLLAVGCGKEEKLKPKKKPKLKPKQKEKLKKKRIKPRQKPKPKPKPKLKKRIKKKKSASVSAPVSLPEPQITESEVPRQPVRKNALDLRREVQITEEAMQEQEKKWDVPAFLRRKTEDDK